MATLHDEIASSIKGVISWVLEREDGTVERGAVHNIVTDLGHAFSASAYLNNSTTPFVAMAIGTSGATPQSSQTALGGEVARKAFTTKSATGGVVSLSTTFGPGEGTGTIAEAGTFNSTTPGGGTMFNRGLLGPFTKNAGDTLTVNWQITF